MRGRRSSPPETLAQARNWEVVKGKYQSAGLCEACAAQAAFAHQSHGGTWDTINPPCVGCVPVVAGFPDETPSPLWRKHSEPLRAAITPVKVNTPGNAPVRTEMAHRGQQRSLTATPTPADLTVFTPGQKVKVQRDEKRWPSKGTWATFSGHTGVVETVNPDTKHPHLTEYGLTLKGHGLVWFKAWELVPA